MSLITPNSGFRRVVCLLGAPNDDVLRHLRCQKNRVLAHARFSKSSARERETKKRKMKPSTTWSDQDREAQNMQRFRSPSRTEEALGRRWEKAGTQKRLSVLSTSLTRSRLSTRLCAWPVPPTLPPLSEKGAPMATVVVRVYLAGSPPGSKQPL